MPNHANRCMQVTCNFTHPSKQSTKTYSSEKYIYSFPNDALSESIKRHAKRMYAQDRDIRGGWIGHISITTSIRNNMKPDSDLNTKPNFRL